MIIELPKEHKIPKLKKLDPQKQIPSASSLQYYDKFDSGLNLKQHLRGSRRENGQLREKIQRNIFAYVNQTDTDITVGAIYASLMRLQHNIAHWHKYIMKYLRRKEVLNSELYNMLGSDGMVKDADHLKIKNKQNTSVPSRYKLPVTSKQLLRSIMSFDGKNSQSQQKNKRKMDGKMTILLGGKPISEEENVNLLKIKLEWELDEFFAALLESYQVWAYYFFYMFDNDKEKIKLCWFYIKQALKIANHLKESTNPSILSKIIRTHLFHCKFLMECKFYSKAIKNFYPSCEYLMIQLYLVSNKDITNKNDVKHGLIWVQTLRLLSLTYNSMAKCYEELKNYSKSTECAKSAVWIAKNFFMSEDHVGRYVKDNLAVLDFKYSNYLKEIAEIERVIDELYYEKFRINFISEDEEQISIQDEDGDGSEDNDSIASQNNQEKRKKIKNDFENLKKINDFEELKRKTTSFLKSFSIQTSKKNEIKESHISTESHATSNIPLNKLSNDQNRLFKQTHGTISESTKRSPLNTEMLIRSPQAKNSRMLTDFKSTILTTATSQGTFNEDYKPKVLTTENYFKSFAKIQVENKDQKKKLTANFASFFEPSKKGNGKKRMNSTAFGFDKFIHKRVDKEGKEILEKIDIDTHFQSIIEQSIKNDEKKDKKNLLKSFEDLKGDVLVEFKKEEFDKKEFQFSKSLINHKKKEDIHYTENTDSRSNQQRIAEFDYLLFKTQNDEYNEKMRLKQIQSPPDKTFKFQDTFSLHPKPKKPNLMEIILKHADVFKLKNFLILKKKKNKNELYGLYLNEFESPTNKFKANANKSSHSLRQQVKDKILSAMSNIEKNIEFSENYVSKCQTKKKSSQQSTQNSTDHLTSKFKDLIKSTKNFSLHQQRPTSISEVVLLNKKLKRTRILQRNTKL